MKKSLIPTEDNHNIGHAYRFYHPSGCSSFDQVIVAVTPEATTDYDMSSDTFLPMGECCTTYKQLSDRYLYQLNHPR